MAVQPYIVKAEILFREKRIVTNRMTGDIAFAEIKVWNVPRSAYYPTGRKFSLFLVSGGTTLVGIDNHKPKGPHLHLGDREVPFEYLTDEKLLADFWALARKAGYEP